MTGGILAWDGHLLPAVPNLKVFDLSGSDQEILLRAMDLERGAERFYTALSRRYGTVILGRESCRPGRGRGGARSHDLSVLG